MYEWFRLVDPPAVSITEIAKYIFAIYAIHTHTHSTFVRRKKQTKPSQYLPIQHTPNPSAHFPPFVPPTDLHSALRL